MIALDLPRHEQAPVDAKTGTFERLARGRSSSPGVARHHRAGAVLAFDLGGFWRAWERTYNSGFDTAASRRLVTRAVAHCVLYSGPGLCCGYPRKLVQFFLTLQQPAPKRAVVQNISQELALETLAIVATETASSETLAALLDQSLDCIKLIGLDGSVQYMNRNGLCAMEIGAYAAIAGRRWVDLWPQEARLLIVDALERAREGENVRFEAFCPTAKGTPRWWEVSVSRVRDPAGMLIGYLSVSRDVTHARTALEVAEVAAAEMRHRLKNSYAMISGLLSALAGGVPAREEFVAEIRDRLSALGVAQTLFVSREHAPCDIAELLPALLEPFSHPDCPVSVKQLPAEQVDQGQADALALVFGELAVNSTKHGALSTKGTIVVTAVASDDDLLITWSERSTRQVGARERPGGQGLRLIERILTARGGEITFDWKDAGLDVAVRFKRLAVPARR